MEQARAVNVAYLVNARSGAHHALVAGDNFVLSSGRHDEIIIDNVDDDNDNGNTGIANHSLHAEISIDCVENHTHSDANAQTELTTIRAYIKDLRSLHGTCVKGPSGGEEWQRLEPLDRFRTCALKQGCLLRFGSVVYMYTLDLPQPVAVPAALSDPIEPLMHTVDGSDRSIADVIFSADTQAMDVAIDYAATVTLRAKPSLFDAETQPFDSHINNNDDGENADADEGGEDDDDDNRLLSATKANTLANRSITDEPIFIAAVADQPWSPVETAMGGNSSVRRGFDDPTQHFEGDSVFINQMIASNTLANPVEQSNAAESEVKALDTETRKLEGNIQVGNTQLTLAEDEDDANNEIDDTGSVDTDGTDVGEGCLNLPALNHASPNVFHSNVVAGFGTESFPHSAMVYDTETESVDLLTTANPFGEDEEDEEAGADEPETTKPPHHEGSIRDGGEFLAESEVVVEPFRDKTTSEKPHVSSRSIDELTNAPDWNADNYTDSAVATLLDSTEDESTFQQVPYQQGDVGEATVANADDADELTAPLFALDDAMTFSPTRVASTISETLPAPLEDSELIAETDAELQTVSVHVQSSGMSVDDDRSVGNSLAFIPPPEASQTTANAVEALFQFAHSSPAAHDDVDVDVDVDADAVGIMTSTNSTVADMLPAINAINSQTTTRNGIQATSNDCPATPKSVPKEYPVVHAILSPSMSVKTAAHTLMEVSSAVESSDLQPDNGDGEQVNVTAEDKRKAKATPKASGKRKKAAMTPPDIIEAEVTNEVTDMNGFAAVVEGAIMPQVSAAEPVHKRTKRANKSSDEMVEPLHEDVVVPAIHPPVNAISEATTPNKRGRSKKTIPVSEDPITAKVSKGAPFDSSLKRTGSAKPVVEASTDKELQPMVNGLTVTAEPELKRGRGSRNIAFPATAGAASTLKATEDLASNSLNQLHQMGALSSKSSSSSSSSCPSSSAAPSAYVWPPPMPLRVMASGVAPAALGDFKASLVKLGADEASIPSDADILITTVPLNRTYKLMVAINSGVRFVVRDNWLAESLVAGKPLDPNHYLLEDPAAEKRWNFNLRTILGSARSPGVFAGMTFYLGDLGEKNPPSEHVREIITSGGGTLPAIDAKKAKGGSKGKNQVIVISAPEFKRKFDSIWEEVGGSWPVHNTIYSTDYLFTAVMRQKVDDTVGILKKM